MSFSATSSSDPFDAAFPIAHHDVFAGYEIGSKTRVSSVINGAIRNCVLIIAGQSNVSNNMPTAYTPTNTGKVDNFNCYDGAMYAAVDPLLGTSRDGVTAQCGNFAGRLADKLINANLFDRVILVPIPISGSTVSDWDTGIGKDRFRVTINRLAARNITPTAVLWGQGEQDGFAGTPQATYQASLNSVISKAHNVGLSASVPWFIAEQTYILGVAYPVIQAAQAAMVNHAAAIWAGPNADSLTGTTNRQSDNTHFTDAGADSYAGLWLTALQAFGAPF